jgi:hypothetical protein
MARKEKTMKRWKMFAAIALTGWVLCGWARDARPVEGKEYIELRIYSFATVEKRKTFNDFLKTAAIPALNRIGIDRIGVFVNQKPDDLNLYMVLPHKSLESFATSTRKIMADKAFLDAGKAVLESTKKDPVYQRIEVNLMISFDSVPKLEAPAEKKDTRLFQLRTYEAHNVERGHKKIHMFNEGGEVKLFRDVGMNPVFFGESIAGTKIPNLTYMVTFADEDAQKAGWKKFLDSEGWKKLKSNPVYKDTVSRVTNLVLTPTDASQL